MIFTEHHVPQIAPDSLRVTRHKPKPLEKTLTHPDPQPNRAPVVVPKKPLIPEKPDSRTAWTRPGPVPEPR